MVDQLQRSWKCANFMWIAPKISGPTPSKHQIFLKDQARLLLSDISGRRYPKTMASVFPLQTAVLEKPYSIETRLSLAREYAILGYPDLSAGEAYMALLLIDEVRDESGEYHEEALSAAWQDMTEEEKGDTNGEEFGEEESMIEEEKTLQWAQGRVERET